MLGTGFTGSPRAPLDGAIEAINAAGATVVAVDVPSGVDASTGEVEGACVPRGPHGHVPGAEGRALDRPREDARRPRRGRRHRHSAATARAPAEPRGLIEPAVLDAIPRRAGDANKFSSGSVLVVGGSTGLTGAVCLACEGAMRAGAGWVRAAVPASLNEIFEVKLTEVMSVPLPDAGGTCSSEAADAVLEAAERADAVVARARARPRRRSSFALAQALVERIERPAADRRRRPQRPGEARARAGAAGRAAADGPDAARGRARAPARDRLARGRGAAPRERARGRRAVGRGGRAEGRRHAGRRRATGSAISEGGSPALATAGTGDVLSGVMAAFLARGVDAFEAACAAVRLHAEPARGAARGSGAESVIAGDVIEALPSAFSAA